MRGLSDDDISRLIAALLDGALAALPSVVPLPGEILGALYVLFKDGIMYRLFKSEGWKNRSIGKRYMEIEVVRQDGKTVDLRTSAQRNLPLAVAYVFLFTPGPNRGFGPLLGFIVLLAELVAMIVRPESRRLGDEWARTKVVASAR